MEKHNNNEKKENKVSIFEKIFATVIGIVILTIIIISLVTSEPKFTITPITIALLVLLIVVAGIFVFDYISVGNVISLKKENKEIREENIKLRGIYNQNIIKTDNIVNYVGQANTEEIKDKKDFEETEKIEENNTQQATNKDRRFLSLEERRKAKEKALERFCKKRNVMSTIEPERSFSKNIDQIDPVISRSRVFDAYYQDKENEYFLETIVSSTFVGVFQYYLYMELSQLYHYNVKMGKKAKLLLLLTMFKINDENLAKNRERNIEYLKKLFSPAIENGLLEVVPIDMPEIEI